VDFNFLSSSEVERFRGGGMEKMAVGRGGGEDSSRQERRG